MSNRKMGSTQESPEENHEENHFNRLPDDLVFSIINKLDFCETHIRFSVVCKRFASFVPKTHSLRLRLHLHVPSPSKFGFVRNLFKNMFTNFVAKVLGSSRFNSSANASASSDSVSRLLSLKRFEEIKHLRIDFQLAKRNLDSKKSFQWVAVFGSRLELFIMLCFDSVHQISEFEGSKSVNESNEVDTETESIASASMLMKNCLGEALLRHSLAKQLIVSNHVSLCSFEAFDSDNRGIFCMGEEQLARCRNSGLENSVDERGPFTLLINYFPVLDLKSCGYVLKNMAVFVVVPVDGTDSGAFNFLDGLDCGDEWKIFKQVMEEMSKIIDNNGTSLKMDFMLSD